MTEQMKHDLADLRAMAAVKKEFWRRWHNGLNMAFDYQVVYDQVYAGAIHDYTPADPPEAGGIKEADAGLQPVHVSTLRQATRVPHCWGYVPPAMPDGGEPTGEDVCGGC